MICVVSTVSADAVGVMGRVATKKNILETGTLRPSTTTPDWGHIEEEGYRMRVARGTRGVGNEREDEGRRKVPASVMSVEGSWSRRDLHRLL